MDETANSGGSQGGSNVVPSTFTPQLGEAIDHHRGGRIAEAEALYRLILTQDPNQVIAMNNLGLITQPQEAEKLFLSAVALRPDYVDAIMNLGHLYKAQFKFAEAADRFIHAIGLDRRNVNAYAALGDIFSGAGEYAQGATYLRAAVALAPDDQLLIQRLVVALQGSGRLKEAEMYRQRIHRPLPLKVTQAEQHRRTVLVLVRVGGELTPHDLIIREDRNSKIILWLDCSNNAQIDALPPYDVVFNAIGTLEQFELDHSLMDRLICRCRRPILNSPERVATTRRDLMPLLLGDIPDVVIPSVLRLGRDEAADDLPGRLAAGGVTFPLIVRPVSGHSGKEMMLVDTPEQLAALRFDGADAYYLIAYHDYKSADGYYRKYRNFFVDRKSHPYHLAISRNWLVHYFSAEMLAEPWKRDEERRFLEDPAAALGARAMTALDAIARRMDMDFAGIDYTVLADGRVLVFEANATMKVLRPDAENFPYKVGYVQSVCDAAEAMLDEKAKAPSL